MKKIKNKFLKIACVVMAIGLTATGCDCAGCQPKSSYEIWGAPATEKILQDYHEYSSIKTKAQINIDSAKGEYELAQIVMTASGNINSYDVTLSDLTTEDGSKIYAKENITVYNAKYVDIVVPWSYNALAGSYPDAMLEFSKAKEYGENKIASGDNQSVYFSFNVPLSQAQGIYTGKFTITVNGKVEEIPVTLKVRNVEVSEKVNVRSFFINTWSYYLGEYESTQAMLDKYTNALFDYRLAPTSLVNDIAYGEEDAIYYVNKAYELCANDRCSTIGIPTRKADGMPNDGFRTWLLTFAEKCFETNYDLLEKCYVYGIDEPSNNDLPKCEKFNEAFFTQKTAAVNYLLANKEKYLNTYENLTEEFFNQIVESTDGVRHVTTHSYVDWLEPYVDLWCPQYNTFESGLATGVYDGDEVWFYGAVSPRNPYPSYHLDNIALSPRMVGWLQGIYDVQGNLYWATNIYADWKDNGYAYPDDYYVDPSHYSNANGDGFLFYPGKKYGIEGPIPTIRLDAIRDGQEEFELIYAIKEYYKQVSKQIGVDFTADSTIEDISSKLHKLMQVTATTETFKEARTQLLNLSEFTESGICFTDIVDNGEGIIKYDMFVPDNADLQVVGANLVNEVLVNGGSLKTYSVNMATTTATKVLFSTVIDGETITVERKLTGKINLYGLTDLGTLELVTRTGAGVNDYTLSPLTTTIIDGAQIVGEQTNLLQLTLNAGQTEIRLKNKDLFAKLRSSASKLVFNIYSTDEVNNVPVMIYVKYENYFYEREDVSTTAFSLVKGKNTIEWKNINELSWRYGDIEWITFVIGDTTSDIVPDLYLKNAVLYAVSEV